MAGSVSKTILVGNLGDDPTIRQMQNGDRVASFSLATSESWKGPDGEKKTRTEWHKCVIFNQGLVNVAEAYLKKGSKVYLEGQNETRSYDKDGQKVYITEVVLRPFKSELTMLDSFDKATEGRDSGNAQRATQTTSRSDARPQGRGPVQDRRTRSPEFA